MILRHRHGTRSKAGALMHSPIVVAVVVILALFLLKAVIDLFGKSRDARIAAEGARREYEELVEREAAIKSGLERLESADGVEAEIRQKFGVVKEGEEVVVVVQNEADATQKRTQSSTGWWQQFLDWFR